MSEDLKKEVNRPSTKQLLNNFLGRVLRKVKIGLFIKRKWRKKQN